MTEIDWLESVEPDKMLRLLGTKSTERKRLFLANDCCQRIEKWIADPRCQQALKTVRRYADEIAPKDELATAEKDAIAHVKELKRKLNHKLDDRDQEWDANELQARMTHLAACAVEQAIRAEPMQCATFVGTILGLEAAQHTKRYAVAIARCTSYLNVSLSDAIRELFGDPFHPISLDESVWRHGHAASIPRLAQTIYAERSFENMPILADALEGVGCLFPALLEHCRKPGIRHLRGCWVLDLVLGKK